MAKPKRKGSRRRLKSVPAGVDDRLARLAAAIAEVRAGSKASPRTAKLLTAGAPKMVQKLIEEAAEAGIEAMRGDPQTVVKESVDLLYNLVILWSEVGVDPGMVWAEMDRREAMLGMAEKLPKPPATAPAQAAEAALESAEPVDGSA
jgi:phosphoribosyl-ATP pyrophosphohydrolase